MMLGLPNDKNFAKKIFYEIKFLKLKKIANFELSKYQYA